MHSFAQRLHGKKRASLGESSAPQTKGLILNQGWRYDLLFWSVDTFVFRGQVRTLRRRTVELARIAPGERALDVGCGTGALALDVQRRVGAEGRVAGIDPGPEQIARARAQAARRHSPVDFQIGVIERLPFPSQSFDVVFSTLMMHHLPNSLKRQGLAEIARTLTSGGRLVIADFAPRQTRRGQSRRFHAGGSDVQALAALVREAGFECLETETMPPARFSAFPGAGFVVARRP